MQSREMCDLDSPAQDGSLAGVDWFLLRSKGSSNEIVRKVSHNHLVHIGKTLEAKQEIIGFCTASVHQERFTCSYSMLPKISATYGTFL